MAIPFILLLVKSLGLLIEEVIFISLLVLIHSIFGILIHDRCLLRILTYVEYCLHFVEFLSYYKLLEEWHEHIYDKVTRFRLTDMARTRVKVKGFSIVAVRREFLIVSPPVELDLDD